MAEKSTFEAFYKLNKKMYPVYSLGTHGMMRKHVLLDIHSPSATDGEAPLLEVKDHEVEIMEALKSITDKNGRDIFREDIIDFGEYMGVVKYDELTCQYFISNINYSAIGNRPLRDYIGNLANFEDNGDSLGTIKGVRVGNIYTHPELLEEDPLAKKKLREGK